MEVYFCLSLWSDSVISGGKVYIDNWPCGHWLETVSVKVYGHDLGFAMSW